MGGFKPKGGSGGGGVTTEQMYDVLLGHEFGAYLKGTIEYFNDLPNDGTALAGDIYRVQKDGIIFFGNKKGFYQAQEDAPTKDIGHTGWYRVENPTLAKFSVNAYDGLNGTSYFNYTPSDIAQVALANCAGKNGSFLNEFVAKHEYARLTTDTPTLNDSQQVVNNGALKAYAQRIYIENALGIDYENYKGEINSFVDLPYNVGTPIGWTYKALNDSAGHPAGYYTARIARPERSTELNGWRYRTLGTPAEWRVSDGDYMNTTQQFTYTPTGVAAVAQAYCANMSGSEDQAFYCKGEGDGDWSMIGGTKYRVTNREDVQQYVAHVTPSWQQLTKTMSGTSSDYTLNLENGLYLYFDNNGTSSWNMRIQNKSGYGRGYCIDGLWENSSGSKGSMNHRLNSVVNNVVDPTIIYSNWNSGDIARFRVIEGTSGANFMPYHEWEVILYQNSTSYLRATWKKVY